MKLQKDNDGRVFFYDNSMVPCMNQLILFLQGKAPDPRITYLDSISIPVVDGSPYDYIDINFRIKWKRQYSHEQIEQMWNDQLLEEEIEEYGITGA